MRYQYLLCITEHFYRRITGGLIKEPLRITRQFCSHPSQVSFTMLCLTVLFTFTADTVQYVLNGASRHLPFYAQSLYCDLNISIALDRIAYFNLLLNVTLYLLYHIYIILNRSIIFNVLSYYSYVVIVIYKTK